MKSLKVIQVLMKIARVVCLLLFIFAIIGVSGCVVGLIVYPIIQNIDIGGGQTIAQYLASKKISQVDIYSGFVVGLLSSGTAIFLAKYNELFYIEELKVGTPFDFEIVKKMRKAALVNIVTSLSLSVAVVIAVVIIQALNQFKASINYDIFSTVWYGLFLLLISFFCEYGAELRKPKGEEPQLENKE